MTVSMFGLELDITFGIPTPVEEGPGRDLGYTAGSFVGFAAHVTPEDAPMPQRTPAWDEPE
jgi:hypothetical protein